MTEPATSSQDWGPEVIVRIRRDGHLIEQRICEGSDSVAGVVESWLAGPPAPGDMIAVEPHPPSVIVSLLRAIADAIEQGRPVAMAHAIPHLRLELVTEPFEASQPGRGELRLLWQELAHPGD